MGADPFSKDKTRFSIAPSVFLNSLPNRVLIALLRRIPGGEVKGPDFRVYSKVVKMPTNSKGTGGLGKAVFDILGLLSYLLGSFILLAIAVGAIGGIFMSTKRLFQLKRVKKDEDDGRSKPGGGSRQDGVNLISPMGKQKKVS